MSAFRQWTAPPPMPQHHPTDTHHHEPRPPRAPVALLLPPTHPYWPTDHTGRPLPDWYGVHPDHVARLIARYTRDDDLVLDTDNHPTITAAAEYLHRRHSRTTHRDPEPLWPNGTLVDDPPAGAGLVLATLPRLDVDRRDTDALAQRIADWGQLLRPGGHLGVLLTTGPGTALHIHRSAVIAAARTVGLRYHQHIPAIVVALPATEPRTEPVPANHQPLRQGRHERTHRDLVLFATTNPEAADV